MKHEWGHSLYPTEHARDLAAAGDWLTAGGLNSLDDLPTDEESAKAAADEYREAVADRQWDDSELQFAGREDFPALLLEAAEAERAESGAPK